MSHCLNKFPKLKQLLVLFAQIEDPDNLHAAYIRLASFVPSDPECLERTLARLDPKAWEEFVEKIRRKLCTQRKSDGRPQFWELLNESRGYVWLADHSYRDIEFIPEEGEKRADLIAKSPTRAILEVKTVNRSDDDREGDRKRNDPTFSVRDIINLSAFVTKLAQTADPVSAFLWEQLEKPTQQLLTSYVSDTKQVKSRLVGSLNRIINGPCIYEPMRFSGVPLQPLTEYLLEGLMGSAGVLCLNRCLLDDKYPEELSKWSKCLSVEAFRPDMPVPGKLQEKLRKTIDNARKQIEETVKHMAPVEKKIVLLIVNRDFGCSSITMRQLENELQQPDLEVVCQIGDF